MSEFVTQPTCGVRRWKLFGVAMLFVVPCGTVIAAATKLSLDTQSEVQEVRADCQSHDKATQVHRDWVTLTLTEIKAELLGLRNRRARSVTTTLNGDYWLNEASGIRHNHRCQQYRKTATGWTCGPTDGVACKKCGG